MSHWLASQWQRTGRTLHDRPDADRRKAGASKASGYTFEHAGRQIRLGPVVFWIAVGTVVILAGWTVTTATYFAFSNDVIKGILARQAEQQYAYEDRIAELRAQIDRTTSHQLLDQQQLEQKLDQLLRRAAALEAHTMALSGIADATTTGSLRAPGPIGTIRPEAQGNPRLPAQSRGHGAWLDPAFGGPNWKPQKQADIGKELDRIEASLDLVERRQTAALDSVERQYEDKARRVRSVLSELGLKLDSTPRATGGPFIPVALPPQSQSFERTLTRASIARAYADDVSARLAAVPLRQPVSGEIEITSPFGVRVDPFLHVAAMHTGLDFRGPSGEPVHATAAGTVTSAGWSGGYGQMVEIDHGNGLSTRYGHLSEIDVAIGQKVRAGQVIGRLGSTGRSTGPHLHYETRIEGEAVNPEKFLAAGAKLFGGGQFAQRVSRREIQD